LEKILASAEGQNVPCCTGGARACPPEDCGGIWGYQEFLKALSDPAHPEHEEMLDWIGGEFDPERFDMSKVNQRLVPRKRRRGTGAA
ncbi:MAG TPA: plasmid pRiA4b ORF-3 family protein, partial [Burkholderiales bacterium]|nr:plasmid pRiA4b ORF-3 family protein [Burkholderiales bacterium]